jgi:hypothetical protein
MPTGCTPPRVGRCPCWRCGIGNGGQSPVCIACRHRWCGHWRNGRDGLRQPGNARNGRHRRDCGRRGIHTQGSTGQLIFRRRGGRRGCRYRCQWLAGCHKDRYWRQRREWRGCCAGCGHLHGQRRCCLRRTISDCRESMAPLQWWRCRRCYCFRDASGPHSTGRWTCGRWGGGCLFSWPANALFCWPRRTGRWWPSRAIHSG